MFYTVHINDDDDEEEEEEEEEEAGITLQVPWNHGEHQAG